MLSRNLKMLSLCLLAIFTKSSFAVEMSEITSDVVKVAGSIPGVKVGAGAKASLIVLLSSDPEVKAASRMTPALAKAAIERHFAAAKVETDHAASTLMTAAMNSSKGDESVALAGVDAIQLAPIFLRANVCKGDLWKSGLRCAVANPFNVSAKNNRFVRHAETASVFEVSQLPKTSELYQAFASANEADESGDSSSGDGGASTDASDDGIDGEPATPTVADTTMWTLFVRLDGVSPEAAYLANGGVNYSTVDDGSLAPGGVNLPIGCPEGQAAAWVDPKNTKTKCSGRIQQNVSTNFVGYTGLATEVCTERKVEYGFKIRRGGSAEYQCDLNTGRWLMGKRQCYSEFGGCADKVQTVLPQLGP